MNKKILSFEEYAANKNLDTADQIKETEGESAEEQMCEVCEEDPCACEEAEVTEDELESEDANEEVEEPSEVAKSVVEMMKECYEGVITEACAYENDDYPDHTLEGYLKENASLSATLSTSALEQAHAELKDEELTVEVYESCLNSMKESYSKKIEELKETWSAS